jgi:hypothetical protein
VMTRPGRIGDVDHASISIAVCRAAHFDGHGP